MAVVAYKSSLEHQSFWGIHVCSGTVACNKPKKNSVEALS